MLKPFPPVHSTLDVEHLDVEQLDVEHLDAQCFTVKMNINWSRDSIQVTQKGWIWENLFDLKNIETMLFIWCQ